ncbi:hypothetical protein [Agromyces sp. NDB4Y10]|uniref:hypothetical protein n=1 Tax=Agromyces sp. NDB4Y10 TaxID=1775951 RepID=UPI0012F8BE52|nr:hypothetical protein [Agromyces sp. NDB4Y10]
MDAFGRLTQADIAAAEAFPTKLADIDDRFALSNDPDGSIRPPRRVDHRPNAGRAFLCIEERMPLDAAIVNRGHRGLLVLTRHCGLVFVPHTLGREAQLIGREVADERSSGSIRRPRLGTEKRSRRSRSLNYANHRDPPRPVELKPLASLNCSQFGLPVTQWGRLLEKAWSAPARAMSRVYDAVTRLYHGAPASGSPW